VVFGTQPGATKEELTFSSQRHSAFNRRGIEVIERRILPDELSSFSECFITGTAAEVTAVSEIAQWNFKPGAITRQLMDDYTAEVQPKGKAAAA
jgi:branched-chain amino acid aminotransferase